MVFKQLKGKTSEYKSALRCHFFHLPISQISKNLVKASSSTVDEAVGEKGLFIHYK